MKIIVPGDPIPKARARVTRRGFAYDPQAKEKENVRKLLEQSVREFYEKSENRIEGHRLSIGDSYTVRWCFYMPIPKSFNQFKKNASKWGINEHISKPDLSNMVKFYEDAANGIIWKDDSQISHCSIEKMYSDNPRTEIYIMPNPKVRDDIKDIISLFSPDEISSIVTDANKLLYVQTTDLPQVASFLSKIADNHTKKLAKITKNYPNHWKKLECNF